MCICMRSTAHLCIYTVYSEEQNTCSALTNSTCKHYNRLENARNGCMHGCLSHLHLFPSLLSKWHPSQSTKMTVNRLNQVQRPVQAQIQYSTSDRKIWTVSAQNHSKIHVNKGCTHTGREVAHS